MQLIMNIMLDVTSSYENSNRLKIATNFLGILNDIKRRPEDAAKELDVSLDEINSILDGTSDVSPELIETAVKIECLKVNEFIGYSLVLEILIKNNILIIIHSPK